MSSREAETEILVHITAPSRALDDEQYRALAGAYLSFEPSRVVQLPSQGDSHATVPSSLSSQRPLESPEASFRSVFDNNGSPRLAPGKKRTYDESQELPNQDKSQSSWRAPPSVIEDSDPDNDISIAALCSPTRILEHYLQTIESSSQSSQEPHKRLNAGLSTLPGNHEHSSQSTREERTGLLDVSSPFGGVVLNTPCPVTRRPQHIVDSVRNPSSDAEVENSFLEERIPCTQDSQQDESLEVVIIPATPRAGSEPPLSKRQKRSPAKEKVQPLERSVSDVLPRGARLAYDESMRDIRRSLHLQTFEIHAPGPVVGCDQVNPESLVTIKLAKLAKDLELPKRFRPERQLRQLRPFERGYWFVDCSGWDQDLKDRAWVFLGNYIRMGDASWGISCIRDPSHTWMRLYCWGHTVGHIYLLLYLASERKLPHQWTHWYDASGKTQIIAGLKAKKAK